MQGNEYESFLKGTNNGILMLATKSVFFLIVVTDQVQNGLSDLNLNCLSCAFVHNNKLRKCNLRTGNDKMIAILFIKSNVAKELQHLRLQALIASLVASAVLMFCCVVV